MKTTRIALVCLLSAAALNWLNFRADAYPRDVKWREFSTEHFRVIFAESRRKEAESVAKTAEAIHQVMSQFFQTGSQSKTRIVLTDHIDSSDRIDMELVRKSSSRTMVMQLGNLTAGTPAGDVRVSQWMMTQFVAHYAKILRHSMDRTLRQWAANVYMDYGYSGWMEGGMSLYFVNALFGGQQRPALLDMALRTETLEHSLAPLAERAAARNPFWPGDLGMLVSGFSFMQYLAETRGEQTLAQLSREQGKVIPIPGFTKDAFAAVYGKSFKELHEEWRAQAQARYRQQIKTIQAEPVTVSTPLTETGYFTGAALASPDGQTVYYLEDSPHHARALVALRLADGARQRLTSGDFSDALSITADGRFVYFSKIEPYQMYYQRSDLYRLDVSGNNVTRLTHGARAVSPAVSPDGKTVAFVQFDGHLSRLMLLDVESGAQAPLLSGDNGELIRQPAFSSDGTRLAFQMLGRDGKQDVCVMNRDGSGLRRLFDDAALDASPAWGLQDRYLFFDSDRSGVPNIFACDVSNGQLYQITNTLTGAFDPSVSSDGSFLVFTAYSSRGFDAHRLELQPSAWKAVSPDALAQPREPRAPTLPDVAVEPGAETGYKAYKTLSPRAWPLWGYDEDGFQLGASFIGADTLERHQYAVFLRYGLESARLDAQGVYVNNQFFPTIRLIGFDRGVAYGDLFTKTNGADETYWERRTGGGIEAEFPLYKTNRAELSLTVGYGYQEIEALTDLDALARPHPDAGTLGSASTALALRSHEQYRLSISPEKGLAAFLRYRRYDEMFGSDFTIDEAVGDFRLFLPTPFAHHVLMLRGAGGLSDGDTLAQGVFQIGGASLLLESELLREPSFGLRGYKTNAFHGDRFALSSAEYRFPLWQGRKTLFNGLTFADNLFGALFFEAGHAWNNAAEDVDMKYSAGGEIGATLGYFYGRIACQTRFGVAHGFDDDAGETQTYIHAKFLF